MGREIHFSNLFMFDCDTRSEQKRIKLWEIVLARKQSQSTSNVSRCIFKLEMLIVVVFLIEKKIALILQKSSLFQILEL